MVKTLNLDLDLQTIQLFNSSKNQNTHLDKIGSTFQYKRQNQHEYILKLTCVLGAYKVKKTLLWSLGNCQWVRIGIPSTRNLQTGHLKTTSVLVVNCRTVLPYTDLKSEFWYNIIQSPSCSNTCHRDQHKRALHRQLTNILIPGA